MRTLFFMDYESQDLNHALSQPCQFGYIRTDMALQPAGEEGVRFIRPRSDVIPAPGAVLTHGILPSQCEGPDSMSEYDFFVWMNAATSWPGTTTVGYNSLGFDENLTRMGLWRNLQPVYEREFAAGCSRIDMLSLARAFYALRPAGINWPVGDDGRPSFRLGSLCAANGIDLSNAHDAYADTAGMLQLARLFRSVNPQLFDHWSTLGDSQEVGRIAHVNFRNRIVTSNEPFLLVDTSVGMDNAYVTVVAPVCVDPNPTQSKSVLCIDLVRGDLDELLAAPAQEIYRRVFEFIEDIDERRARVRLPLYRVRCNRAPFVAPYAALRSEDAQRLGISRDVIEQRLARLRAGTGDLLDRIGAASRLQAPAEAVDVDSQLYNGFVSDSDKGILRRIQQLPPEQWISHSASLVDARLKHLVFRCVARNFEQALDPVNRARWQEFRRMKLLDPVGRLGYSFPLLQTELAELRAAGNLDARQLALLDNLERHATKLVAGL